MFKLVICVGIFMMAIGAITLVGAVRNERYIGNAVNKDYPGMCYYNDTQTAIKVNTTYRPLTECTKVHCRDDFVIRILYCPPYQLGEDCTINRREGIPYPDCCPNIECPKRP